MKSDLLSGKCENYCGRLTKVRFGYGAHGAVYLRAVSINNIDFDFPTDSKKREFYDVESWKDSAPGELKEGKEACIWYRKQDSEIARLDVE